MLNTPVLWIFIPGIVAVILYFLRRWERVVIVSSLLITLLLTWLAWRLPIGELVSIGPWSFRITDTFWILGRRLILTNAERPLLVLIYLSAAFWFGGVTASRAGSLFIPAGLAAIALLTASLAVNPYLYAALFIEMAALVCIPLLASSQKPVGRGVLRFLTFQTLGVPFILFSGWLTDQARTDNQVVVALQTVLLAAFGFSFLLAVFPFHTWMPMLAQESHPYTTAFVFYMLPGVILLFALRFVESQDWLLTTPVPGAAIRMAGALMVAIGGVWAAFQRHTGRMLAYAIMVEIGYSILAIGIQSGSSLAAPERSTAVALLFPLFISRGLALGIWALALSAFYAQRSDLHFNAVRGAGRHYPIAASALILAHFALAGFPLLAGFQVRLTIIGILASLEPIAVLWVLLGMGGLMVGGLRTLAVLVMGPDAKPWEISESRPQLFFLVAGIAALVLAGIFPMV